MQEQSRVRLAAALAAALGFVTSGTANAAMSEQPSNALSEKSSLMAVDTADSYRVNLASKDKKVEKGEKKGKDGSGKSKDGSGKGKDGSCKGKDGSCKGKDGSCKGKDGSCKGKDEGGQLPGTGTGSDY